MNILNKSGPWDHVAEGYHKAALHLFRTYARAALEHVDIPPGLRVADIACGPGTLTTPLAERGADVAAIDFSARMLELLVREVTTAKLSGVSVHQADGQALPFEDGQFDAAFSLFGLMFFPDRAKGHAEMFRTLRPTGIACVSSWSKLADSPLFDVMAQALQSLDPARAAPEYDINSLENPDVLKSEMFAAGFRDVVIHRIERRFAFASDEDLWRDLTEGSAPVAMMRSRLPPEVWRERSAAARAVLRARVGPFPAKLGTTAWFGVGRKPPR